MSAWFMIRLLLVRTKRESGLLCRSGRVGQQKMTLRGAFFWYPGFPLSMERTLRGNGPHIGLWPVAEGRFSTGSWRIQSLAATKEDVGRMDVSTSASGLSRARARL